MTGRQAAVTLVLGLFATSAAADNAVRRDGSSSGGSQGAGSRQPGVHSSGSSGSGGSSYSGGSASAAQTPAQRRQPRPGTGTGYHGGYHGGHHGGYYPYYPYYPYGYYGSYWWPYGSLYGGFYAGGYYPYPGGIHTYAYSDRGSLRLLVDQPKARVYVDGYYAGVVDEFDGLFQRLYVSPGRHDIAFKLEGYLTHRVKVYVGPEHTLKIHHDMQKGSGPETVEDLAGDVDDRYARRDDRNARPNDERYGERDPDAADQEGPDDRPVIRDDRGAAADLGRLRLSVLPDDASVYVDGRFKGSARGAATLELAPGRHRIEVVRPGFRTEERDVEVEPGSTRELGIELQRP